MKKAICVFYFVLCLAPQLWAAPKYILIQQTLWRGMRLVHFDKEPPKLHKWFYDARTDTYYRMKNKLGFGIPIKSAVDLPVKQ